MKIGLDAVVAAPPGRFRLNKGGAPSHFAYYANRVRHAFRDTTGVEWRRPLKGWMVGLWCIAMARKFEATQDSACLDLMDGWLRSVINKDGSLIWDPADADQAGIGYGFEYLGAVRRDSTWLNISEKIVKELLEKSRRAENGCLTYHRRSDIVFVDTVGMICPFLVNVGNRLGNSEAVKLAIRQLDYALDQVDEHYGLPYHGSIPGHSEKLGLSSWGRGSGWLLLGMVDMLSALSNQDQSYHRFSKRFEQICQCLAKFQKVDGHWGWDIRQPSARSDSSATAFIGYAMVRGRQQNILTEEFDSVIDRALSGMRSVLTKNGLFSSCSDDCAGVGAYSQNFGAYHFSQSMGTAFFAAASRVDKDRK